MSDSFSDIKNQFILSWGDMGSKWGINKAMSQIHALLMVSDKPLSTDEVMAELKISRGNANMNLRGLVDWGLVQRVSVKGDRKEYFQAEKDVWKMFCTVARERKKREIEPVISVLQKSFEAAPKTKDSAAFRDQIGKLLDFLKTADYVLGKVAQQEQNKVLPRVLKLLT